MVIGGIKISKDREKLSYVVRKTYQAKGNKVKRLVKIVSATFSVVCLASLLRTMPFNYWLISITANHSYFVPEFD